MSKNTNHQKCLSKALFFDESYPCQLNQGHKGKHNYSISWNNKEALRSGGTDSKGNVGSRNR